MDFGDYYEVWNRLTPDEKELCKANKLEALLSYRNKGITESKTVQIMGISGLNDRSDAFRHAYFQALNTMDFGATLTQQFADAHESQVPSDLLLEKQMDLFNNAVGIYYGYTYVTSNDIMATFIHDWAILKGQLRYLNPTDFNIYFHGIIPGTTQLTPTNE